MADRTHLALVHPVDQVCRLCTALVAPDLTGDMCGRCLLYMALDRATSSWPAELRSMLAAVIAEVVLTVPPEDMPEFFALVSEICQLRH